MAYDKQTFVINQVLTAAECNQLEENIAQVRVFHVGSAEPPQTEIGVAWLFDGQTPWIFRVTDTGSAWLDAFHVNATDDEIRPVLPSSATTNSLGALTNSHDALVSSHEAVTASFQSFEATFQSNIYSALAAFDVI